MYCFYDALCNWLLSVACVYGFADVFFSSFIAWYFSPLSMWKFSKMARYDITGIGINLREVPDESGGVKLKVLGLLLDGPAHTAGVRQVAMKQRYYKPMSYLVYAAITL